MTTAHERRHSAAAQAVAEILGPFRSGPDPDVIAIAALNAADESDNSNNEDAVLASSISDTSPMARRIPVTSILGLPVGTLFIEPDTNHEFPDQNDDTVWEVASPGEAVKVSHDSGETATLEWIQHTFTEKPFLIIGQTLPSGPTADTKAPDSKVKALLGRRLLTGPAPATTSHSDLVSLLAAVDQADAVATRGPWAYGKNSRGSLRVDALLPEGDPAARFIGGIDEQGNPERFAIAHPPSWSNGPAVRPQAEHDMRFIALARTALPALATALREIAGDRVIVSHHELANVPPGTVVDTSENGRWEAQEVDGALRWHEFGRRGYSRTEDLALPVTVRIWGDPTERPTP